MDFQAVWVTRSSGAIDRFEAVPVGAGEAVVITNLPDAFDDLVPVGGAVDIMKLYALVFPDFPCETLEQLLPEDERNAAGVWRTWERVERRLVALPLWALEAMREVYRYLEEGALERVITVMARRVERSGIGSRQWQDSFKAESGRVERKEFLPEHDECSALDGSAVAAHILPGGCFARLMPGYEVRGGQVEMLHGVTQAFNEGRHLLVEAGTGVGKSVGYLLPAAAWALLNDLPVIISTNTRNLQSQLIEKDVPLVCRAMLEAHSGTPLRVALIKGRSNYLCLRRLSILLEQGTLELDRNELRHFAATVAWAVMTPDGDLDTLAGAGHAEGSFLAKISSTAEECPGRSCRYWRRCFLQKARAKAMAAHIVVANHALVFAELQAPGAILPLYAQVVFDEAHNLEEVATRYLSCEISPLRLRQLINTLSRVRGRKGSGVLDLLRRNIIKGVVTHDEDEASALRRQIRLLLEALEDVQTLAKEMFELLFGLVAQQRQATRFRCVAAVEGEAQEGVVVPLFADAEEAKKHYVREVCHNGAFLALPTTWHEAELQEVALGLRTLLQATAQNLLKLGEMLRQLKQTELPLAGDQASGIDGAAVALRTFAHDLEFVLAANDVNHVFWAEPESRSSGSVKLFAAPLSIGETLASLLYEKKSSVIFCSATLRVGSSFSFICKRLGIDRISADKVLTCVAQSPFNYLTQCAALAPNFLPSPTGAGGGAYVEQLSALMLEVFVRTRGCALGLFTSYEMMQQVAALLEQPLSEVGIRLLVQGSSGSRDQITRIFRSGAACVLLGAQSFWEGVDVVGEALSCVVMARLPFAAVQEPIFAARCEQIDQAGGNSFREFSLPTAVIRFRQGFGRLIRSRSDKGIVMVADPRIINKSYGKVFSKSLPCSMVTVGSRVELLERVEVLFAPDGTTGYSNKGSSPQCGEEE